MKNKLGMENLIHESFKIIIEDFEDGVILKFFGDIDMKEPHVILNPFFDKLHLIVIAKHLNNIYADFSNLSFINSSGIKSLIWWLKKVMYENITYAYKVTILYDSSITWQATSLESLSFLAPELISTRKVEGGE